MGKEELRSRSCAMCGKEFFITYLQGRKIFCDSCKPIHEKQRKIKYQNHYKKNIYKHKRHLIVCEACGKEFIAAQGRQPKKCVDCLMVSESPIERMRAYYRKDFSSEKPERIRLHG